MKLIFFHFYLNKYKKPNIELSINEKDSFDISNISDAFMLIYTDELLQSIAKNSYNYFTQKMKDKNLVKIMIVIIQINIKK